MKSNLIEFVREHFSEFKSNFLHNREYKYSEQEEMRYFFWMCELQKWLREVHNIHIQIIYLPVNKTYIFEIWALNLGGAGLESRLEYKFYELALEEALYEALTLIK